MRKTADVISRIIMGSLAALLLGFGFFGFSVAAMAGVEFPVAYAIAMSAATSQATWLAWLSSGMIGLACFCFTFR